MNAPNVASLKAEIDKLWGGLKELGDKVGVLDEITAELYNSQQELIEWKEKVEDLEDGNEAKDG